MHFQFREDKQWKLQQVQSVIILFHAVICGLKRFILSAVRWKIPVSQGDLICTLVNYSHHILLCITCGKTSPEYRAEDANTSQKLMWCVFLNVHE